MISSENLNVSYDGEEIVGFSNGRSTPYYYVKNTPDDVVAIVDGINKVIAQYSYDAYGKIISITDSIGADVSANATHIANLNPIRYRGYYYDKELQMYYLQSRYYDPTVGRFINADDPSILLATEGQVFGANLFAYCGNDPVMNSDLSGYWYTQPSFKNKKYNRNDAVNYAYNWYNKRNTAFYNYGADCANFVSQCLYAGGLQMVAIWHSYKGKSLKRGEAWDEYGFSGWAGYNANYKYKNKWDVTKNWSGAASQYQLFHNSNIQNGSVITINSKGNIAKTVKHNSIKPGDLMYFIDSGKSLPHHATIITKVTKDKIFYTAHTSNRKDANLADNMGSNSVKIIRIKNNY